MYYKKFKIRNVVRILCGLLMLAVICIFFLGFYVRIEATKAGQEWNSSSNETGSCYLKTYIRKYSSMGVVGRFFSLFGSQFYYRVYSKNGELLKTSEWAFWETQLGADQSAYWIHGAAFYLTTDGLKNWELPACDH
jgi:hypothetical protein